MVRLLIFIFLVSTTALAQFWQDINGVPQPQLVYQTESGRLLLGSAKDGVYYSDDDGASWFPTTLHLQNKNVSSIVGRDDTIFAIVNNKTQLYRSMDNGFTWSTITRDNVFDIAVSNSGDFFGVATYVENGEVNPRYRVLRFDGSRWQPVGTSTPFFTNSISVVAIVVDHFNNFYLATYLKGFFGPSPNGIYVSTDGGNSWENHSVGGYFIDRMTVTPSNTVIAGTSGRQASQSGIFESADTGRTWTSMRLGYSGYSTSLASDSSGNLLFSTTRGLFRYREISQDWEFINTPADTLIDYAKPTRSGNIIVCSMELGVFRSTDDGETWSSNGPGSQDVFALTVNDSGYIFAGTLGNRMYTLKKIGANWHQVSSDSMCDYVFSLAKTNSAVYAGTDCGVYRTTDDGDHWSLISQDSISGSVYSVATNSSGDIFAGTGFGVYRSTNSGATWMRVGLPNYAVFFLAVNPSNYIFAATDKDGVYSSTDNGTTWQFRGLKRDDIETIVSNDAGVLYAGVYGGIAKSTDNGISWQETDFTNGYVYTLAFGGGQDVFAGTYNGVYVSHDGGNTWVLMSSDGLAQKFVLSIAFDQTSNLVAGTYHGGAYRTAQTLTSVETSPQQVTSFRLYQNYPNPFNPTTEISYQLPIRSYVVLKMYDLLGQEVTTLVDGVQDAGFHSVQFNASGLSSGIYFYRLTTPSQTFIQKMLLVR